jgi:hypothetical protein
MADLITKADYKAYVGITSVNSDTAIDSLIPKVSALVRSICRRTFNNYVSDAKTEYCEGGAYLLVTDEYPVLTISSLEQSIDYGKTYTPMIEFTDYVLNMRSGEINSIADIFPFRINGYKIVYTAGFETIPEDLKLAVMDLVTYYIKNDSAVHSSKPTTPNTVQVQYITNTNLPAHIKRVLDLYAANYN